MWEGASLSPWLWATVSYTATGRKGDRLPCSAPVMKTSGAPPIRLAAALKAWSLLQAGEAGFSAVQTTCL